MIEMLAKLLRQPVSSRAAPTRIEQVVSAEDPCKFQFINSTPTIVYQMVSYCSACKFQISNYFFILLSIAIRGTIFRSREAKAAPINCLLRVIVAFGFDH